MRVTEERFRVLSLAPAKRGVAFACLEDGKRLIDYSFTHLRPIELRRLQEHALGLARRYKPDALVLRNHEGARRDKRSRQHLEALTKLARAEGIRVYRVSEDEVRRSLAPRSRTKHERAVAVAERFPELLPRLRRKRRPWESEAECMAVFEAVALLIPLESRATVQARIISHQGNEAYVTK